MNFKEARWKQKRERTEATHMAVKVTQARKAAEE